MSRAKNQAKADGAGKGACGCKLERACFLTLAGST